MSSTDPIVAALLRERAGLVQRGLTERIKQVDKQLQLRGHAEPETPQGRSTPPTQTADLKTVREWAAEQDLECPARGRIPDAVMELFTEAHRD